MKTESAFVQAGRQKSNLPGLFKGKVKWKGFSMMRTVGAEDVQGRRPFTTAASHGEKFSCCYRSHTLILPCCYFLLCDSGTSAGMSGPKQPPTMSAKKPLIFVPMIMCKFQASIQVFHNPKCYIFNLPLSGYNILMLLLLFEQFTIADCAEKSLFPQQIEQTLINVRWTEEKGESVSMVWINCL